MSLRLRTILWMLHRWIGIGFAVLLLPIAISGALLVWHDHLDAVLNPARYAVTGGEVAQPLSAYFANSRAVLPESARPVALRFPWTDGRPVLVIARVAPGTGSGPPRLINVYLDPSSARVLDVVDFRSSFFGFLHRLHENLTIPEYSGRAIVGWVGVGMLILSLSGLWLWWPRNGTFPFGLRWGRTTYTTSNLHHLFGFWICIPLAVVSASGIYLGFPQQARSLMASIAPMNPQPPRPNFGAPARDVRLSPEAALDLARAAQKGARPTVIFLPTAPASGGGERGRARGEATNPEEDAGPLWRVQLRMPENRDPIALTVDDRSDAVTRLPDPLAGDRAAQWIRRIHDGTRGGPIWQAIVFLTGVLPAVFVITGVAMWLRGRRSRKAMHGKAQLQAAE